MLAESPVALLTMVDSSHKADDLVNFRADLRGRLRSNSVGPDEAGASPDCDGDMFTTGFFARIGLGFILIGFVRDP